MSDMMLHVVDNERYGRTMVDMVDIPDPRSDILAVIMVLS